MQWGVHDIVEQADEQNGFMELIHDNFQGDRASVGRERGYVAGVVRSGDEDGYWEVVTGRMMDNMVLHLIFNLGKVVNKKM